LHVYAIPVLPLPEGQVMFSSEQLAEVRGQLEEAMARTKARVAGQGVIGIETVLVDGTPADVIVDEAGKRHSDLIVMATHGRTGLSHILIGSVAERVVRTAPCPVLTVRTPTPKRV
jgi:nucleotide-binding universal stress UspA family protein